MAPGMSGRPTGTVPKNKSKSSSGSQSHRLHREPFIQSSPLDWEPMSDIRNKKSSYKSSAQSADSEANSTTQVDLERSRSSTMTSQSESREGCSQSSFSNKINIPDRKQVVNKLSQIQSYLQQTADLMDTIKSSDSPAQRNQYNKLSVMLEELKDSETKLRGLLNKMDNTESRIDSLLTDLLEEQPAIENGDSRRMQKFNKLVNDNYGPLVCVDNNSENNNEVDEEEISRKSDESKKKLEALQKRKQELLLLQEKAKKQLLEAQAEQSRLVARASSLNQELSASKPIDLNVQQLSQRLKAVQQIYNTRNQINDSLKDNRRANLHEAEHPEEDPCQENSDTETDFQLVADKMEELNVMKAQLGEIQKIMVSINGIQTQQQPLPRLSEAKENTGFSNKSSLSTEGESRADDPNSSNIIKLEQAKSKLNHLTQLLEIVQTAQSTAGLSPSYLQLVSNLVNEEAGSSTPSPSLEGSVKSTPKNREDVSMESMQVMTRELEETTAAMKEERDKLAAARQELQNIARRIPQKTAEGASLSPGDSESEPPFLKNTSVDSNSRDILNGSDSPEADQSPSCNEGSFYSYRAGTSSSRSKQRAVWSTPSTQPNASNQERRSKNGSLSRGSAQSSRVGSRCLGKDSRWSPSPSVSYDKSNPAAQAQNQLELSSNLCELMLSESLQQGIQPGEITLQEMFHQHQLLTRTVAQCSQLLWLQQKQIIELRNALMLQTGGFSNLQLQQIFPSQTQTNVPTVNNSPYSLLQQNANFASANQLSSVPVHQHQNCLSHNQNQIKLNCREIQRAQIPQQEQFPDQFSQPVSQGSLHFPGPDLLAYETRLGNFSRLNPPISNSNQNINQNIFSGSNNRVPNGLNCLGPEDSGALNNQVPPGNRANNYWDNFRSYSRQNLLSTTKSNEDTESSRRTFTGQERLPRDLMPPSQNNQTAMMAPQQTPANTGNPDAFSGDHHHHHHHQHHSPSQNAQANHHAQITRSRSVEPQGHRNTSKNETRHQDNDSRMFMATNKNEGVSGVRARHAECGPENLRGLRNDVNHAGRNDNLNSSRNFDNDDTAHGISKKRLERSRCRKEGTGNLNNRSQCNTSLWENISSEVSNFIRTNEARPQFLIQLFRDLQQVTNDNLRQRTLDSIQETVNANNLIERSSNTNSNVIENRNNIRENRSNINRNQGGQEDPARIDELFYHLRENQNTIRQNIGMNAFVFGGNNLENPNISNIRDLVSSRNNLESEGLKDLRTYFEANLCSFGGNHSTLENPNLSNIRENLTRRGPGMLDHENVNPKNVYLSIYDNVAVELRRRNQESLEADDACRNFEAGNNFGGNEFVNANESVRTNTNQFELGNSFDGAVGGRGHYHQENASSGTRFPVLDGGDSFLNSRQFITNANDSGIDINYNNNNNDERKRSFAEGEVAVCPDNSKVKKIECTANVEMAAVAVSQWERSSGRDTIINSVNSPSPTLSRNDISLSYMATSENSFFECPTFQQSDNGDLAEADQSRNEASGAESDSGFLKSQILERTSGLSISQNQQNSESNFSSQNIPESERNFTEDQSYSLNGTNDAEGNSCYANSASEAEGNFRSSYESIQKSESSEVFYYPVNAASTSSELVASKSSTNYRLREEAAEREQQSDLGKGCNKSVSNKFRDNSTAKCNGATSSPAYDNQSGDSDSANSFPERQFTESRESLYSANFQYVFDKNETEIENMSQEAESDWECGSGLDQVPTRLKKNGSKKSTDSTL